MPSPTEIGLAEADRRIADAEHNIRQLGSMIPELAINGYATAEIEGQVEMMMQALDYLREQRRSIVVTLDGNDLRRPGRLAPATARTSAGAGLGRWRGLFKRA
jgi:hypothetical protein